MFPICDTVDLIVIDVIIRGEGASRDGPIRDHVVSQCPLYYLRVVRAVLGVPGLFLECLPCLP